MTRREEHVSGEFGDLIAAVLAAAGEGMASMRAHGAAVSLRDCSIEVLVDEETAPSAHLKLRLEADRLIETDPG